MKPQNIYKYLLASSLWLYILIPTLAQQPHEHTTDSTLSIKVGEAAPKPRWLSGMSLSVDILGSLLANVSSYGNYETALRLNLYQIYFPTIEVGVGVCNRHHETTQIHFKTRAPYLRLGADLNIARDKQSGNRIFLGLRYGVTSFTFDLTGPPVIDPIWQTRIPLDYRGQSSTMHWGEFVFGLEAKIWKNFHIGWSGRYRKRITQRLPAFGQAWYVPGYGKNSGHVFGGSFNLTFDL